jgi:hypothetical protein
MTPEQETQLAVDSARFDERQRWIDKVLADYGTRLLRLENVRLEAYRADAHGFKWKLIATALSILSALAGLLIGKMLAG